MIKHRTLLSLEILKCSLPLKAGTPT